MTIFNNLEERSRRLLDSVTTKVNNADKNQKNAQQQRNELSSSKIKDHQYHTNPARKLEIINAWQSAVRLTVSVKSKYRFQTVVTR